MEKHIGEQTVRFKNPPSITETAAIVGQKEGDGPLAEHYDVISPDALFGTSSWEKAESEMSRQTISLAVQKAHLQLTDIQYILAGDLLNQETGSTFAVRDLGRPFFGLFSACSAIGEAMTLGAMIIDGGFANHIVASASSHYCGAEKTFRFPLELGTQRPPTASWTVTGAGAVVLSALGVGPYVTAATTGKVVDMGIKDANNMGAAMAPAAADVLTRHFRDLNIQPSHYDVIATGDLGQIGSELLLQLMNESGYNLQPNHTDCGLLIYDRENQDVHAGGSGCGCAAATFAGYFYKQLKRGEIKRMLLVPTGALHSVATIQQGESIPGIAHAVAIETAL
ncbi:MAG: stage V sporulation protein AD [Defluviitaleaceae bacterium]|nr:stage V sporulation protein AD [Defluviitaleaceae bacterium]